MAFAIEPQAEVEREMLILPQQTGVLPLKFNFKADNRLEFDV